jgi:hypothetical protein
MCEGACEVREGGREKEWENGGNKWEEKEGKEGVR